MAHTSLNLYLTTLLIKVNKVEFREDKGTGYLYCYNPLHPCANKAGKVLEHVYVVYKKIKRRLRAGECVHHVDRDRKNN